MIKDQLYNIMLISGLEKLNLIFPPGNYMKIDSTVKYELDVIRGKIYHQNIDNFSGLLSPDLMFHNMIQECLEYTKGVIFLE